MPDEGSAAARWQAVLDAPMEELELGVRAYNILKRRGIGTCGQVLRLNLADAAEWTGEGHLGDQALRQLREAQAGLCSMRVQLQREDEEAHVGGEGRGSGLSEEQRTQVLHAATSGLLDLIIQRPDLTQFGADDLTLVFLAGVNAGVDAFDRVLTVGLREWRP